MVQTSIDKGWLAGSVTTITLFVLVGTLLLSLMEARAAARAARMQASLAEAAETSRAKDEFLAMLGHELRNPLASISNAVHLLQHAGADATHRQFAQDVIARQTVHLARIVDDLLDVGRAITGKMLLRRQPIDLHATVAEALRGLEAAGTTPAAEWSSKACGAWVDADRTRIEQVVNNLVSNAVQHTAAGGRIAVRIEARAETVELTVSDDGTGMDADTAERVFELFSRASGARTQTRWPWHRLDAGSAHRRAARRRYRGRERRPRQWRDIYVATAGDRAAAGKRSGSDRFGRTPRAPRGPGGGLRGWARQPAEGPRARGHTVQTAADGPTGVRTITQLRPDVALIDIGLPGSTATLFETGSRQRPLHLLDCSDRLWSPRGPQPRPRVGVRRPLDEAAVARAAASPGGDGDRLSPRARAPVHRNGGEAYRSFAGCRLRRTDA